MTPVGQTLRRCDQMEPHRHPHEALSGEPDLHGLSPRHMLSLVAFTYMMYDKLNDQSNGC
ncbi:MAG: hypothetical protein ACK4RN_05365 [Pseudorhodobacter sp.]